ncbi:MAG: glycosyltransferase family 1 protein [Thermoguttaceae bacterium]|jgi:glycosyltransferase involved in cell wall biosynthesis
MSVMQVTFFHRRPQEDQISVERVFAQVRAALPAMVEPRVAESTFRSRGFWPRLYNAIEAVFRQGDVNHVTGDVHFLDILLAKKKTLLTIHDCVVLERLHGLRWWLFFFFWYWLPARRASIITVISRSAKRELLRYLRCDPAKIRVVHNPCPREFHPAPRPFNEQNPLILQVGTRSNKNLLRLAEALRGIRCRLRIVGRLTDEQIGKLQDCRIDYSAVAEISDDEIADEYRRCDMLVFVSTYEGFGMPIIEAQATGRPVVTSNIFSMPEVAGAAAALADPFDAASIRATVLRVIRNGDYRAALIRRGYENTKRFSPRQIALQYAALYRELHPKTEGERAMPRPIGGFRFHAADPVVRTGETTSGGLSQFGHQASLGRDENGTVPVASVPPRERAIS